MFANQIYASIAGSSVQTVDMSNITRFNDYSYDENKKYKLYELSHGASILTTAPGINITMYNPDSQNSISEVQFHGSSFSAPIVSAIAALMLEANSELGWRDVQEIMAHSSTSVDDLMPVGPLDPAENLRYYDMLVKLNEGKINAEEIVDYWKDLIKKRESGESDSTSDPIPSFYAKYPHEEQETYNNAKSHNGVGMHYSDFSGYGYINAETSLRLAESWPLKQNSKNLYGIEFSSNEGCFEIKENFTVEFLSIAFKMTSDLLPSKIEAIYIESPSGTRSIIFNGIFDGSNLYFDEDFNHYNLKIGSRNFHGENSQGVWCVKRDLNAVKTEMNEFLLRKFDHDNEQELFKGEFKLAISGKDPEQEKQLIATNEIFRDMKKNGLYEISSDYVYDILNLAALSHENVVVDFFESEISLNDQKVKLYNMGEAKKIILNTNNNIVNDNGQVHEFVIFSGNSTINLLGDSDKVTFFSSEKLEGVHHINGVQNWTEQVGFANENIADFLSDQDAVQFVGENWEININN